MFSKKLFLSFFVGISILMIHQNVIAQHGQPFADAISRASRANSHELFCDTLTKVGPTARIGAVGMGFTPLRSLRARGWFGGQGLHLMELLEGSPLLNITDDDGRRIQLQPGDIIESINGNRIFSPSSYQNALQSSPDSNTILLTVIKIHSGNILKLPVQVGRGGFQRGCVLAR
ncbi:MAG: hypothetical protein KF851_10350 [Pirellulaceae bacterium]|nr:hypothetical protein [Pirellulaceae bacterium]